MTTGSNKLKLEITLGTDGLVEGINVAGKTVDDFKQKMRFKMPQQEVRGFTETLREFKVEQTQNARMSRFLGNELQAIIPGAEGAGGALRKLAGLFAEGFGIGLAIEGVKLALELIAEHINEHEKKARDLRNTYIDVGFEIRQAALGIQRDLDGSISKSAEARRAFADKTRAEFKEANKEIQELLHKSGGVRDFFSWLVSTNKLTGKTSDTGIFDVKSIDTLIKEKQALLDARSKAFDQGRPQLDEKAKAEDLKRERFLQQEIRSLYAATRDEILRIEADKAAKLLELEFKGEYTAQQKAEKRVAIERDAARRIALLRLERETAVQAKSAELEAQFHDAIEREAMGLTVRTARMQVELAKAGSAERRTLLQRELDADGEATAKKISLLTQEEAARNADRLQSLALEQAHATEEERLWADAFQRIAAERRKLDVQASQDEIERARARIQVITAETQQRVRRVWEGHAGAFVDPLMQSWQTGLEQMLSGTYRWADLTKNIFGSIGQAIVKAIAQWVTEYLGGQAKMLLGSLLFKGKEVASHVAAEGTKTAATAASAGAQVSAQAAVGGAAAAATAAETPGIGWLIALPAAAAVVAGIMGLKSLIHASGGYDVPSSGRIPLTQLHHSEMVLPAKLANPLRAMLAGGGGQPSVTLNLTALDGKSAKRFLMEHGQEAVLKIVREALKDNRF